MIMSLLITSLALSAPLGAESENSLGKSVTLSLQESVTTMLNNNIDLYTLDACFAPARNNAPAARAGLLWTPAFKADAAKKTREMLMIHLTRHYYALAASQQLLQLQEGYLEELDTHYRNVKKMFTKGLIAQVELLKVKRSYEEAEIKLLDLEKEGDQLTEGFRRFLKLAPDLEVVAEALPRFLPEFSSFKQWLHTSARNQNIISEADILKGTLLPETYFPPEATAELKGLYAAIDLEYNRFKALEDVVKTTTQILSLEKKRFQNTLAASDVIIEALAGLYAAKERELNALYTYHVLTLDAQLVFESLKKK
jgi:outer membrane protein TolC